jgi:hypothetical protein
LLEDAAAIVADTAKRRGDKRLRISGRRKERLSQMLDDVARILSLTPEDRLRELAHAAQFFATARRSDNPRIRSSLSTPSRSGVAAKKSRKVTRIRG